MCENAETALLKKKIESKNKQIKKLEEENKVLTHMMHGDFDSLSPTLQKKYREWFV